MPKTFLSKSCATFAAAIFLAGSACAQVTVEVVRSDLFSPRDVAVDLNGDVYVIEAGAPFDTTGLTPITTDTGTAYYGNTGNIIKFEGGVGSTKSVWASGLPTLFNPNPGGESVGGHGIFFIGPDLYVSIGLGSTAGNRAVVASAANLGSIFQVTAGAFTTPLNQTDISGSSTIGGTSSNPFHAEALGGVIFLADAADNSILEIDGVGNVSRVAFLPDVPPSSDYVPTSLALHPTNGLIYVGGLTGLPFPPDSSTIYTIDPDLPDTQTPQVFATGFTQILDLAFGADGTLYVLEMGLTSANGALWSVSPDGLTTTQLLSDPLVHATGMTIAADGTIYVTDTGLIPGSGRLLAITVPEPGASLLGVLVLAGLAFVRRRK
jgi:MYXO-CTERM domain-containing protein